MLPASESFSSLDKSLYLLHQKIDLHYKELCLVQDVPTRWGSAYYMVERIIILREPLSAALCAVRKGDLMPTDSEFVTLEQFIEIMKRVAQITGGEKWVTISIVRPLLHRLLDDHLLCSDQDSRLVRAMKTAMIDNLHDRYTEAALIFLNFLTFLDPRFKLPSYLKEEKTPLVKHIEQEVLDKTFVEKDERPEGSNPAKKLPGVKCLLYLIGNVGSKPSNPDSIKQR